MAARVAARLHGAVGVRPAGRAAADGERQTGPGAAARAGLRRRRHRPGADDGARGTAVRAVRGGAGPGVRRRRRRILRPRRRQHPLHPARQPGPREGPHALRAGRLRAPERRPHRRGAGRGGGAGAGRRAARGGAGERAGAGHADHGLVRGTGRPHRPVQPVGGGVRAGGPRRGTAGGRPRGRRRPARLAAVAGRRGLDHDRPGARHGGRRGPRHAPAGAGRRRRRAACSGGRGGRRRTRPAGPVRRPDAARLPDRPRSRSAGAAGPGRPSPGRGRRQLAAARAGPGRRLRGQPAQPGRHPLACVGRCAARPRRHGRHRGGDGPLAGRGPPGRRADGPGTGPGARHPRPLRSGRPRPGRGDHRRAPHLGPRGVPRRDQRPAADRVRPGRRRLAARPGRRRGRAGHGGPGESRPPRAPGAGRRPHPHHRLVHVDAPGAAAPGGRRVGLAGGVGRRCRRGPGPEARQGATARRTARRRRLRPAPSPQPAHPGPVRRAAGACVRLQLPGPVHRRAGRRPRRRASGVERARAGRGGPASGHAARAPRRTGRGRPRHRRGAQAAQRLDVRGRRAQRGRGAAPGRGLVPGPEGAGRARGPARGERSDPSDVSLTSLSEDDITRLESEWGSL